MLDQTAILERIKELVQPLLTAKGVELVELTGKLGGGRFTIRCLVDTANGITVDELTGLNRSIGALIEEHDLIPDRYLLEVSSPGLDRPLKTARDFERVIGRRIKVTTSVPLAAQVEHKGEVLSASEEAVVLRLDSGDKLPIQLDQITHAVQEIELR